MTKRPKIQTSEGPPDKFVSINCQVEARPDSTYPIIVEPYKLDMTQLGDKVRDEMTFSIKNVSDQKLNLSVVSESPGFFTVKLPSSIDPGKAAEAKLMLGKEVLSKDFEKSFTIELSDSSHTRFTVPVKRTVRPSIQTSEATHAAGTGR